MNCKSCHACGTPVHIVLDGEEWCPTCQTYQRPAAHGSGPRHGPAPMTRPDDTDLLAIPDFLRRDPNRPTQPRTPVRHRKSRRAPLPPESMVPVLRAIKRGRDTMQKLRQSLGTKYSDREIKRGIDALLRIKSIHKVGRRYLPIQLRDPRQRRTSL